MVYNLGTLSLFCELDHCEEDTCVSLRTYHMAVSAGVSLQLHVESVMYCKQLEGCCQ